MTDTHEMIIPRPVLFAAAALVGLSILAASLARVNRGVDEVSLVDASTPATLRELRFVDRTGGGVEVFDALTRESLGILEVGKDGFVRGVMRALARQRRLKNISRETPVQLIQIDGHGLVLFDPATGQRVYLNAFGQTNVEAFTRFMN